MNIKPSLVSALLYAGIVSTSVFASDTALLTSTQQADLIFMYQEEKVARDVYNVLGEQWSSRTFANIQKSEQRHMDAIKNLLKKYNLPVPVIEDLEGVFENEELQALYDELVEQGGRSLTDALSVGVLVEETDIADLESRMVDAPKDIVDVYSKLLKGSNNHLLAFNRVLDRSATSSETISTTKGKKDQKKRKETKRKNKKGSKRRR